MGKKALNHKRISINDIKTDKFTNFRLLLIAVIVLSVEFVISHSYYSGKTSTNPFTWVLFIGAIVLFYLSLKKGDRSKKSEFWDLFIISTVLGVVYFVSHLISYKVSPWNDFGLFDDAAWDIYFVQDKVMHSSSVDVIFADTEVGGISRELVFHHYIAAFFRLFGANLFVFNMALTLLGFVTVLFTSLLAYRIWNSKVWAIITGLMLNYLPLHYTQVYMGHRYAICPPLLMVSLYCLYYGHKTNSVRRIAVGGVFAGLCLSSAIMGKQYIYALIGTAIILVGWALIRKRAIKNTIWNGIIAAMGFAFSAMPLFTYIVSSDGYYNIREENLTKDFFAQVKADGFAPIRENLKIIREVYFEDITYRRQFSVMFPVLNYSMIVLILIGLVVSFIKKHYYVTILSLLPTAGCIIAPCYDFRILLSASFFVIAMVFALHFMYDTIIKMKQTDKTKDYRMCAIAWVIIAAVISVTYLEPVKYIRTLRKDTHGQYLLSHDSIAASRFIQDVVVGEDNPNCQMKENEFNRSSKNPNYNVLAATCFSYAPAHAYLYNFDAYKVLSLLDNFPYFGVDTETLTDMFVNSIDNYYNDGKDLMIVIECGYEVNSIIDTLRLDSICEITDYCEVVDGLPVYMTTIRVKSADIDTFKLDVHNLFNR